MFFFNATARAGFSLGKRVHEAGKREFGEWGDWGIGF